MPLKKTFRKGKPTTTKTTGTVALVKKVVDQKLQKHIETKSAFSGLGEFLYQDDVRATNLMYFLNQGDALANYTGRSINLKNIHIKGRIHMENPSNQPNGMTVRILVIRTKQALTNSSATTTYSNVFRAGGQPYYASTGHVDFGKVQLLLDKKWTVQPFNQSGNANRYISYDIKVPFNGKKLYWDGDNSGYLKNGNYYLIVTADSIGASSAIDRVGLHNANWTVNFQDA